MQSKKPVTGVRMSKRELRLHQEADRIAETLFNRFFEEIKTLGAMELGWSEWLALTVDTCTMLTSRVIGTMYHMIKHKLSDFVTPNLITETHNNAFKKHFESFLKLKE